MTDNKTIFAPASASGKAGVAVFRISGRDATRAITKLCAPSDVPPPRLATLREIKHPVRGDLIDKALVLYFPAPNSFTGEDVVEFHTHGGRAVTNAVIETLYTVPNFRLAEAGEFTRRAFENGKLDLTEAEAIVDLVHADTEAQRKQALRQMGGALGMMYEKWRATLARALAYMEAAIDFADEELPRDMIEKQNGELKKLCDDISQHLNDHRRGERMRDGFSIVLLGAPNVGKSSLLNALAQRDVAIVSPTAGTTRDIIEAHLDINGYPVLLTDTAGLRDAENDIESEGIRRARARAAQADLKLVVLDGTSPDRDTQNLIDENTIVVVNKCDLPVPRSPFPVSHLVVSAKTGAGIDALLHRIGDDIARRFDNQSSPPLTRARHRAALEESVHHLNRALVAPMADMRAEDVRLAMRSLGRITGRVDVEDLLDIIFKDFCVGK